MISTAAIYIHQRFSYLWLALSVYLYLYIFGISAFGAHLLLLPYIAVLLFIFRLFDDLESRQTDIEKPTRIYTIPGKYFQLRGLLGIAIPLYIFFAYWLNKYFAISVAAFLFINLLLYQNIIRYGKWRAILPLLKYPFICLVFGNLAVGFSMEMLLQSVSLFAAFLLFENLDDAGFQLEFSIKIAMFLSGYLYLVFTNLSPLAFLVYFILAGINYYIVFYSQHRFSAYFFLFIFLLTRLFYAYEF